MLYPWRCRATTTEEAIVTVVADATTPFGNIKPDQLRPQEPPSPSRVAGALCG